MRQIIQHIKWLIRLRRIDKVICEIADDDNEELEDLHIDLSLYYCQVYNER